MVLIGRILKKYVEVSNRMTENYTEVYGLLCDIYFPINAKAPTKKSGPVDMFSVPNPINVFAPHQDPTYDSEPTLSQIKFYIPYLIKKQAMNASELEFDTFYTEDESQRPFLETSKSRELPIGTKVVVFLENSTMYFWIDKKLVVNGADGHMLLRQYLSPLAKG